MCFNETTSIVAGMIGMLSGVYLIYRNKPGSNDLINGILVMLISLVQFVEYKIWQDPTCSKKNRVYSIVLILVLIAQPILLFVIGYSLKDRLTIDQTHFNRTISLVIGFIIISFTTIYILLPYKDRLCTQKSSGSCRLSWGFLDILDTYHPWIGRLCIISYMICFYYVVQYLKIPTNLIEAHLIQFLLVVSLLVSWYYDSVNLKSIWGSLWCFLSAFYGVVCILN